MKFSTLILFLSCKIAVIMTLSIPDNSTEIIGANRKYCPYRRGEVVPLDRKETKRILEELRVQMTRETSVGSLPIDAYIITTHDEHQSEFVADYDKRLEYVSGFSGSEGLAVITNKLAAVWVDGRYHIQADNQLSCDWLLMRKGQPKVPKVWEWLIQHFPEGGRVGADPKLMPNIEWTLLKMELEPYSIKLIEVNNLVDAIWMPPIRPQIPSSKAYVFPLEYAGEPWASKVEKVRKEMKKTEADAYVVTALDEIAWLFNIRGKDIPYNPVVRSYVIVTMNQIHWYVAANKIDDSIQHHLKIPTGEVILHDYENIRSDLRTFSQVWTLVLLPSPIVYKQGVSRAIYNSIPETKRLSKPSPIIFLKARKNQQEITGMENAHIRDAVAMCDFLAYFENKFENGDEWDELRVVKELDKYRYEQHLTKGVSFPTIAGFGPHGAIPHYEPNNFTNVPINENSTLVIDSGGQYLDGTTDVTRTLHFGVPTAEQKSAYTRVLIGSIELSSLVFPSNMLIIGADIVARAPLWKVGLDYMHGTGHGIGAFLNVHESPISLSYQQNHKHKFKEGYFFSNEPGYYKEGDFGVRLENIMEVIADNSGPKHYSGTPFLKFKDVTLVPYEPKLMDGDLLNVNHRRWLNEYNSKIRSVVGAELKKQLRMDGFYWMMKKTKHIPEEGPLSASSSQNSTMCLYILFLFIINALLL